MPEHIPSFQTKFTFEQRLHEATRILQKYPTRIPIIIEKLPSSKELPDINKRKYLVPRDLTLGQFMYVIRKRLKPMSSDQGLYLFVNNKLYANSQLLAEIYNKEKHEDNFLYMVYAAENTFG